MEHQPIRETGDTSAANSVRSQRIAESVKHQWAVELADEAGYDRDGRKFTSLLELETQLLANKSHDTEIATQEWYQSGLQYWKVTSNLRT